MSNLGCFRNANIFSTSLNGNFLFGMNKLFYQEVNQWWIVRNSKLVEDDCKLYLGDHSILIITMVCCTRVLMLLNNSKSRLRIFMRRLFLRWRIPLFLFTTGSTNLGPHQWQVSQVVLDYDVLITIKGICLFSGLFLSLSKMNRFLLLTGIGPTVSRDDALTWIQVVVFFFPCHPHLCHHHHWHHHQHHN